MKPHMITGAGENHEVTKLVVVIVPVDVVDDVARQQVKYLRHYGTGHPLPVAPVTGLPVFKAGIIAIYRAVMVLVLTYMRLCPRHDRAAHSTRHLKSALGRVDPCLFEDLPYPAPRDAVSIRQFGHAVKVLIAFNYVQFLLFAYFHRLASWFDGSLLDTISNYYTQCKVSIIYIMRRWIVEMHAPHGSAPPLPHPFAPISDPPCLRKNKDQHRQYVRHLQYRTPHGENATCYLSC